MTVLLLGPTQNPYWERAIEFLTAYGVLLLISIVILARWAPDSLESQLQLLHPRHQSASEHRLRLLLYVSIIAWLALIPVEVFRLQLLPYLPALVIAFGALLFFSGYVIVNIALYQNQHPEAPSSDSSRPLVNSGLYAHIRHPYSLGLMLMLAGISLWLDSLLNFLLLPVLFAMMIARIKAEEKLLLEQIPEYKNYTTKVPYCLIPYLW